MKSSFVIAGAFALTLVGCAAPNVPGRGSAPPAPAPAPVPMPTQPGAPVATRPEAAVALPPKPLPLPPTPISAAQLAKLDALLLLTRELLNL